MPGEIIHSQHRNGMPCRPGCARNGFALVITLSLMILLTVLAVGLLSLSSIALRGSAQTEAIATARANARMALMLALGDLQRQTGPDTRVTARADILDSNNPPVLGVWTSWQGADHEKSGTFAGRPVSPGNYASEKKKRFVAWLTSTNTTDPSTLPDTALANGKVTLVGTGALGTSTDRAKMQIHLTPTAVTNASQHGSIAWWISGENQKARLPKPYKPSNDSVAGWASNAKSHTVVDPKPFRLEQVLDDPASANKAISLRQGDLIATDTTNKTSREFFHDLSATSVGLLTNTATGGWRKDLSLLTENWDLEPKSNQPFFRVKPGEDIAFNIPVSGGNYRPDKSLIYPWSAYRSSAGNPSIDQHGAVSSWENLKDWATLYKSMDPGGTTIAARSYRVDATDAVSNFNFLHKTRTIPVIARIQWVFSHYATPNGALYNPQLLVTPIITLWNPYNVSINSFQGGMKFWLLYCTPEAFRFNVGNVQNPKWNSILDSHNSLWDTAYSPSSLSGARYMTFSINSTHTFKPGETLSFSPAATPVPFSDNLELTPGLRLKGGFHVPLKQDNGSPFTGLAGNTNVKVEARFDTAYGDGGYTDTQWQGVGINLDENNASGDKHLAYRMQIFPAVASAVYKLPPNTALTDATLELSASSPQPFMTTIFGARTASQTHLASKGFVQSSPFVNFTIMGQARAWQQEYQYPGSAHPVNSPFDYSFRAISTMDSLYPSTDAANHGFIVSGFQNSDGLSRCIIAELPTQPIQSLAELQNWNLRYENPVPPYCFNIIGNSDATPLVPAKTVFNEPALPQGNQDLQHDDSFCANHLLFDDWFVSSIAPKLANLGKPAGSETSRKTFTDFVSGKDPLPNRAYMPITADAAAAQTTAGADGLFDKYASKAGAWKTIASRIEVEGMFNVNSTSVNAWRALLGHARDQKIPYVTPTGSNLSGAQDYAFSRFSVAGDVEAKSIGTSGQFSTCAEFAGYRKLTDPVLDRFAEQIVNQVRARGPFLSLAEFVNRQLSSGGLALAGTIQAALNALANDSSTNPYSVIQAGSAKASAAALLAAGYSFPEAADGYNAYGLPGWTRQADVLRPIAPILSARDDTFTIRAYGDACDKSGKITARATCEAIVRRTRDYMDPVDAPDITTLPKSAANLIFGRRFEIISFRWLTNAEI